MFQYARYGSYYSGFDTDYLIGYFIGCFIFGMIGACIFGAITKRINENKGYDGGFAWGFWLGVIGIIVVACRPEAQPIYFRDSHSSPPPRAEIPGLAANGGWYCTNCGRQHPAYELSCVCGMTKQKAKAEGNVAAPKPAAKPGVSNGVWYCTNCGRQHLAYESSCVCGTSKKNAVVADSAATPTPKPAPQKTASSANEEQIIQALKEYKTLLDEGIITQEEFENKKKSLLG